MSLGYIYFKCDDGNWYRQGATAAFQGDGWFLSLDEDDEDEIVLSTTCPWQPLEIAKLFDLPIATCGRPGPITSSLAMKGECRRYRITFHPQPVFPSKWLNKGHKPTQPQNLREGTYIGDRPIRARIAE